MDYVQPLGGAAGDPYVDANPALAIEGSAVPAAAIEHPMREIMAVIAGVGLAGSGADLTQLKQAIERMIDAQSGNYALDTGVANAYVVALNPAIAAYSDGMTVRIKVGNTNLGASTLNAGGGAVPLVNNAGGALLLRDIVAGSVITATYVLSENKFRITSMVTSQYGLQASGVTVLTAATILGSANFGQSILLYSASPFAVTLPDLSVTPAGKRLEFKNINTGAATINCAGADTSRASATSSPTSFILNSGDSLTLESNGGYWVVVGGSNELPFSSLFGAQLATSGYQKLPSGLIIQWTTIASWNSGTSIAYSWPVAFPNAIYAAFANDVGSYQSGISIDANLLTGGTLYAASTPGGAYLFGIGR